MQRVSIIIPIYNEAATIEEIIRRVQGVDLGGLEREILVVNDGSTDATATLLGRIPGIRPIHHAQNRGKGAAIRTGFQLATGNLVILQDGDLEYDPQDLTALIRPILEGRADAVMGSRFLLKKLHFFGPNHAPFLTHYLGNQMIIWFTNLLYHRRYTDYEGCYKAFTAEVVRSIPLTSTRFEIDNELICKLFRRGDRVIEVPIHYHPRSYQEGKKITWRHGVVVLWTILKWRILPVGRVSESV